MVKHSSSHHGIQERERTIMMLCKLSPFLFSLWEGTIHTYISLSLFDPLWKVLTDISKDVTLNLWVVL